MNRLNVELLDYSCSKGNELLDNFSFKILQLENRLIADIKTAKDVLMQELNEDLKMVDKFDVKNSTSSNLRRINKQGKLFKDKLDEKLDPVYKLKDQLKLNNFLKVHFETILDEEEINDLYELIGRIDLKKLFDTDEIDSNDLEIERAFKEWSKKMIDNFGSKTVEKIDNLKSVLNKSMIDFKQEISIVKQDIEKKEFKNDFKSYQDEQNMKKMKETLRTEFDKELKEIVSNVHQANQTNEIKLLTKELSLNKKSYLNELRKSDCRLIIQYLEHIQIYRKKLWSKLSLILSELITNLNTDQEATRAYNDDEILLKSLNDCIEKTIKNYDAFISKLIDQTFDSAIKKLKEFDDQYIQELQINENRLNRELADKFVQSFDQIKIKQNIEMMKKN